MASALYPLRVSTCLARRRVKAQASQGGRADAEGHGVAVRDVFHDPFSQPRRKVGHLLVYELPHLGNVVARARKLKDAIK